MTKRIFRSILLVALGVFLASVVLIMGVLYGYFNNIQQSQLKSEIDLAAQGLELSGMDYFQNMNLLEGRITWLDADGTVLFDTEQDAAQMENHADREEFQEALRNGWGESTRYSSTLTQRTLYYARRLADGTVVRMSMAQSTVLNLVLGMAQPICVVFALALVLSLVLAHRLSRNIVAPLNRLNLDAPLTNEGYDELAPLLRRIDSQQQLLRAKSVDLRRKQEEFATVTGNMSEGLILLGREDTVLSINPAAAKLLETDRSVIGRDILTVNRSPELQELLHKAHLGQQSSTGIVISGRSYQLEASPVESEGTVSGIALLLFDVTERLQAEQMRREFTANVSHELKTPLHAISGYAELMAGGIAKPEDTAKFAASIYAEAQRMIRLVEDIIKLSQLDEGSQAMAWEQTDLYTLAAQAVQSLEPAAAQAQVTVKLTGEAAQVSGVPQLLSGIVYNLCDNAIKYNHPGGRVTVHVASSPQETVLTVADTGIGIPKESQNRVFERFYRVDKSRSKEVGGTGLGLSIVKHAVMLHGGTIELQSAPGTGTTILVHFPKKV